MKKKDDKFFLLHILDAISRIELYLRDISEDNFKVNCLVQDGVIRQLEIIGEAVKALTLELKESNKEIPWQDIAGMRDKLIHHYFGVDLTQVWLTAKEDIPALKAKIASLIKE